MTLSKNWKKLDIMNKHNLLEFCWKRQPKLFKQRFYFFEMVDITVYLYAHG